MPWTALQGVSGLCVSRLDHLKLCVRLCRGLLLHAVMRSLRLLYTLISAKDPLTLSFSLQQVRLLGKGVVPWHVTAPLSRRLQ